MESSFGVGRKRRVFGVTFKARVVRRRLQGKSVCAVCRELSLHWSNVYRRREHYCLEGLAGRPSEGSGHGAGQLAEEAVRHLTDALGV